MEATKVLLTTTREDNTERNQALAAMGLKLEQPARESDAEVFQLLPDIAESLAIFVDMSTQWHVGPVGASGLRYEALEVVMRLRRVAPERQAQIFEDVRVCELAALEHFESLRDPHMLPLKR